MAKSKKYAKPINLKSTKNYKKHQERVKLNHLVIKKLEAERIH
jgi:hypothetical protein